MPGDATIKPGPGAHSVNTVSQTYCTGTVTAMCNKHPLSEHQGQKHHDIVHGCRKQASVP